LFINQEKGDKMYRLYYGNGQVSRNFESKKECEMELKSYIEWRRIHNQSGPIPKIQEKVEEDMWVTLKY
jgi:hypothetical protein